MSLEVDGRQHGVPISVPQYCEDEKFVHHQTVPGLPSLRVPNGRRNLRDFNIVPYMVVALIVMTASAAISAGLAGSFAQKRTKAVEECSIARQ